MGSPELTSVRPASGARRYADGCPARADGISSDTAAQPRELVVGGTLTTTLPARSLVTFAIR